MKRKKNSLIPLSGCWEYVNCRAFKSARHITVYETTLYGGHTLCYRIQCTHFYFDGDCDSIRNFISESAFALATDIHLQRKWKRLPRQHFFLLSTSPIWWLTYAQSKFTLFCGVPPPIFLPHLIVTAVYACVQIVDQRHFSAFHFVENSTSWKRERLTLAPRWEANDAV